MLVGYARVSSMEQNLDLQIDALREAGCQKIFEEEISGAQRERPVLQETLSFMREGDVLICWRLDRLGRSLEHLIGVVNGLQERGIGFRSLQEGFDTTSSGGHLIFHVFGAPPED